MAGEKEAEKFAFDRIYRAVLNEGKQKRDVVL